MRRDLITLAALDGLPVAIAAEGIVALSQHVEQSNPKEPPTIYTSVHLVSGVSFKVPGTLAALVDQIDGIRAKEPREPKDHDAGAGGGKDKDKK